MSLLNPALQAFVEVIRAGTVQGAAKALRLTQTGVTQRIRGLEAQLGATLFLRSRKGMRLTPEGEALQKYCRGALELEGPVLAAISGVESQTELRLAILGPTSFMRSYAIPRLLPVLPRYPHLAVSFEISDHRDAAEALRKGEADLAILPAENVANEMEGKVLRAERYYLVGPKRWAKRSLREMLEFERIIDFDPSDQMSYRYLERFGLRRFAKRPRHFVNNNESLYEMFAAGLGYGVLTGDFVEAFASKAEIAVLNGGKFLENRLALAWYPRPQAPAYFRDIVSVLV